MATRKPKKPRLTEKVRRGLEEWTAVMDLLLSCPNDSELQTLTPERLSDAEAAAKWIDELLEATEPPK